MINRLNGILAYFSGLCVLLMMGQVVFDALARLIIGQPISGTMETVSVYYMVAITFLPLALVQAESRHIAVEVFTQHLSPRRFRQLEIVTLFFSLIFVAWILWESFQEALTSFRINEMIETAASVMSIWPSRFIVVAGIAGMAVVMLVQIIGLVRTKSETSADRDA